MPRVAALAVTAGYADMVGQWREAPIRGGEFR
jgi:hypothetical protein